MKPLKKIILLSCLFFIQPTFGQKMFYIPRQTINPLELLLNSDSINYASKGMCKISIDSFEISEQIQLGEYKKYLLKVKQDSSYEFYLSQLPDSAITTKENYSVYLNSEKYETYPVVGITWEAAMNFCKWKTFEENKDRELHFIYRLPKESEWLASLYFLRKVSIKNDFDTNYSDWTMSLYFDGGWGVGTDSCKGYGEVCALPESKSSSIKRYRYLAIGSSYFFQREKLIQYHKGYYSFHGYRHITFRILKTNDQGKLAERVYQYWNKKF